MGWLRQLFERRRRAIQELAARRTPAENKFIVLIPVVGLLTGLSGVGIAHLIAWFQKLFWGSGEHLLDVVAGLPWYFYLVATIAGGLIVGLIGLAFKIETRGAGTVGMIQGVAMRGGYVSLRQALPRTAAGIITVGCGGSLGREGPSAQLGGALGSYLGRRLELTSTQTRILLCAGAGAAMGAVYNAPIGGSLFAIEILMGSFALEVFGPVVIASVIGTLVYRSMMGNLPRFVIPQYELVSGWELIGYLCLGVIAGLVSLVFIKSLFWSEDLFEKVRLPKWLKPALGFGLLGGLAILYPQVLGNGYEPVNMALHEQFPWQLLLILPLAKLVATALTLGSGGAGGLFLPSLMVGGLLGGAFGNVVHGWFPHQTAGYGAYALVGMGAIVAGTTHAPLTAIMLIYEQTNSYQIVLPLMFACIISTATVRLLRVRSAHDESLHRRGIRLPRGPEAGIMQSLRVRDVMHDDVDAVLPDAPFRELVERCLKTRANYLYVIDREGRFRGAVPLHAIKEVLHQGEHLASVVAFDLLRDDFEYVTPMTRLADTMDVFWRQNTERLPVLEDAASRKLIGYISRRDLIGIYSQEILQKPQLLTRFQVEDAEGEHSVYVPLPKGFQVRTLVLPRSLAGSTLAALSPRSSFGVHVLQVTHLDPVTGQERPELPGPATKFAAEDRLVVIGTEEGIDKFERALEERTRPA